MMSLAPACGMQEGREVKAKGRSRLKGGGLSVDLLIKAMY
jgi:hypothetical protein